MHALSAAVVIFLDIFHGTPTTFNYDNDSIYHKTGTYWFGLVFSIFWSITMPATRYLGGVHSLDQIIFGSALGFWVGIFCHFVMRDNIIWFFEKVINW